MTKLEKKNEYLWGSAPQAGIYRLLANGMYKDKGGTSNSQGPCHWHIPTLASLQRCPILRDVEENIDSQQNADKANDPGTKKKTGSERRILT